MDHRLAVLVEQRHAHEHVGAQRLHRIGEGDTHLQRARLRIEFGIDVVHGAVPLFAGPMLQLHPRPLAQRHPGGLALEDLGQYPNAVQIGD